MLRRLSKAVVNPFFSLATPSDNHAALMGDIEVEKESENDLSFLYQSFQENK